MLDLGPREFEVLCKVVLADELRAASLAVTPSSQDGGIDIEGRLDYDWFAADFGVQGERYSPGNVVGNDRVHRLAGALVENGYALGTFVTTSSDSGPERAVGVRRRSDPLGPHGDRPLRIERRAPEQRRPVVARTPPRNHRRGATHREEVRLRRRARRPLLAGVVLSLVGVAPRSYPLSCSQRARSQFRASVSARSRSPTVQSPSSATGRATCTVGDETHERGGRRSLWKP